MVLYASMSKMMVALMNALPIANGTPQFAEYESSCHERKQHYGFLEKHAIAPSAARLCWARRESVKPWPPNSILSLSDGYERFVAGYAAHSDIYLYISGIRYLIRQPDNY